MTHIARHHVTTTANQSALARPPYEVRTTYGLPYEVRTSYGSTVNQMQKLNTSPPATKRGGCSCILYYHKECTLYYSPSAQTPVQHPQKHRTQQHNCNNPSNSLTEHCCVAKLTARTTSTALTVILRKNSTPVPVFSYAVLTVIQRTRAYGTQYLNHLHITHTHKYTAIQKLKELRKTAALQS